MVHLVGRRLIVPRSEAAATWGSPPEAKGWPAVIKRYLSAAKDRDKRWEILCDTDEDTRLNRLEYGWGFIQANLVLAAGESHSEIVCDRRSKAARRSGQTGSAAHVQARASRSAAAASAGQAAMMGEAVAAGATTTRIPATAPKCKRAAPSANKPAAAAAAVGASAFSHLVLLFHVFFLPNQRVCAQRRAGRLSLVSAHVRRFTLLLVTCAP